MKIALLLLAVLALGLLAYIRMAPTDTDRWHTDPAFDKDETLPGGVRRVVPGDEDTLARLDAIIRDTPRTQVVAGSVSDGHITYVTRSRAFGFPDYTTAKLSDGRLRIFGRLRFGGSDLGVNAKRVDGWLQELSQGR